MRKYLDHPHLNFRTKHSWDTSDSNRHDGKFCSIQSQITKWEHSLVCNIYLSKNFCSAKLETVKVKQKKSVCEQKETFCSFTLLWADFSCPSIHTLCFLSTQFCSMGVKMWLEFNPHKGFLKFGSLISQIKQILGFYVSSLNNQSSAAAS